MGRTLTRLVVPEPLEIGLETSVVEDPGPREVLIRNDYTVMNLGTEMTIFTGDFPPGSWWDRHIKYPNWEGWGCLGRSSPSARRSPAWPSATGWSATGHTGITT